MPNGLSLHDLRSAADLAAACADDPLVAADAWSAPTVGFMAGVAVGEDHRGAGLGSRVCRFLADRLIAGHGRVALMVDWWNDPAIRLYRRLGMTLHEVRAAGVEPG